MTDSSRLLLRVYGLSEARDFSPSLKLAYSVRFDALMTPRFVLTMPAESFGTKA
jgi:hypothetical protein